MDYSILNRNPDVAQAIVPHTLNSDGVTVSPIGAGNPQAVSGQSVEITASPTVTASAYTAGYVLGGVLALAGAVRSGPLSGVLNSIRVSAKSVQTTALKVYLFNANPASSTLADHGAPSIAAADVAKLIGVYTLSSTDSGLGTHTEWTLDGIGKVLQLPATTLYVVPVAVGTPTPASTSDFTFGFGIAQD
jgi:hypothetical protein